MSYEPRSSLYFTFRRLNQPCTISAHDNSFHFFISCSQRDTQFCDTIAITTWTEFYSVLLIIMEIRGERESLHLSRETKITIIMFIQIHISMQLYLFFFFSPFHSMPLSLHSNEYRIVTSTMIGSNTPACFSTYNPDCCITAPVWSRDIHTNTHASFKPFFNILDLHWRHPPQIFLWGEHWCPVKWNSMTPKNLLVFFIKSKYLRFALNILLYCGKYSPFWFEGVVLV